MGFLQAREKAMQQQRGQLMKPCLVYFGCRDSSEELYSEQMLEWLDSGVITGLHVAMSRGQGPKVRCCVPYMCVHVCARRALGVTRGVVYVPISGRSDVPSWRHHGTGC